MDIKIGFSDSPRELVVSSRETQDEVVARVSEALANDSGLLTLTDENGNRYLVRNSQISYVEVGNSNTRTVGFSGA
ncbi:DUF3107 domain-containing protein [Corynebacterium pseudotuberculosis]|uniref:DUF3107 family protein n=2 Tax=Corynebacterium pseudotuberculosis TaxID=1719 RepID=D9QEV5_CORP2|nr:DUF3107 domain-containing protein [Corynebacterium pseudotuberculosis]AER68617.1 Hypothetical protein Cp106_0527 [Corynebacterium pseudotuberculosis 1/06-A]ADK28333.1 DUF3107 family protein [Corynebacterium pseudotuberculosis FRC41]ADL10028.1 DUF3107 family protein [Corynebacterium pseudotuberculosis C231]ADL20432.1 DUF3107 domain-containing protein [Corynebacterium pseudotuberculosis 1002]ADO25820.1 DUF3107 family protein [Corynebacterium pseudotuberculosis I19]